MKYIILIALFLVGCSDDADINRQLLVLKNRVNELETSVLYLQNKQATSEAKYGPTIDDSSCIKFVREIDTHAIASVTIPVDGKYYVSTWNEPESVNYYKNGTLISRVKMLIRDTCPDFERMKRAGIIK